MKSNDEFIELCRNTFKSFNEAKSFFIHICNASGSEISLTFCLDEFRYGSSFEWQGLTLHENDMKVLHNENDESINLNTEELHGGLTCFTKCVGDVSVTYTFNSVEDLIKYEKSQN